MSTPIRKIKKKKWDVTNLKIKNILKEVMSSKDFVELRRSSRLNIPLKTRYKLVGKHQRQKHATIKNIAARGCLLLVMEKLPLKSEVEFEIFLGGSKSVSLKVKGSIVRFRCVKKGLYEYGISFATLSPESRRLFTDFCFAKMYEMTGLPMNIEKRR